MAGLTASTFNTTTTHECQYTGLNPFFISPLYAADHQGEHGPHTTQADLRTASLGVWESAR